MNARSTVAATLAALMAALCLGACAGHERRCDGRLQPINDAPASPHHAPQPAGADGTEP